MRPFVRLPRGLAPLGYRNFAIFWIGHAASNTGRWLELTGAVWLLYELTASPVLLGLVGLCRSIPLIALSSVAGVIADRVDQRRLLFATQAITAASSFCLGVLVLTGHVQFWHVYIQVALQAVVNAFDASARQSLFPRLLPRERLTDAVTLYSTGARVSALAGPSLGGIAIASLGVAAPFLLSAVLFTALMAAVAGLRGVVPRAVRAGSSFRGELVEGLRHMMAVPVLMGLLKLEVAFGLFSMNPVMIAIIGRESLDVDPRGLGGLLSAPAVGGLLGIAGLLVLGQVERQGRFVILCTFAYAGSLVALAMSGAYLIAFVALAAIGLLDSVLAVTRNNIMQLTAPGRMRGRVMGNLGTVTRGVSPLAQTQSGVLAGALGGPPAVICAAIALAVTAGLTAATNRVLWNFSRADMSRPADHTAIELPTGGVADGSADLSAR
jgi:MFS family permease